ncbi:MAG TPA: hypothetical protein VNU92_02745 [Edaphobacter sp.]|nr:hypothetical protein [Edaphobacter sp.]
MASAVFPGPNGPVLVPLRKPRSLPSLSNRRSISAEGDLTIHRITKTHHGRTLLTLGHAAEYLENSRRYWTRELNQEAHVEAIHILMGASQSLFREFAEPRKIHQRVQDFLVKQTVCVIERIFR